jgi:hypothetical protein
MAEPATYLNVTPISRKNTAVAIGRGLRCLIDANGLISVAGILVKGDVVTAQDFAAAGEYGLVFPVSSPGAVPAVASEAVAVGDDAYSAANGQFSKTSTGAVYVGRWVQAASGAGVLGAVLLGSPE